MKNQIISLAFLFVISAFNAQCKPNSGIYWEQMSESVKKETVASDEVDVNAANYYKGNFVFTDNEKSFQLLDVLTSEYENPNIKALYFYLFNEICTKADGAISEVLGNYCQKVLLNDPVYVLNYFSSHSSIMRTYAQLLGYELYFKNDGTSDIKYNFTDFKKLINEKIKNDDNLKMTFNNFNSEIEKIMKNMD